MKKIWRKILTAVTACTLALSVTGCASMKNQRNITAADEILYSLLNAGAEQIDAAEHEFVGLSDVSAVGVDAARFTDEEAVDVNEADYDVVLDAVDYGVTANDKSDDSLAMAQAIAAVKEAAVDDKKVLLKLPQGELYFVESMNAADRTCAVLLQGLKNVTVLGNNTMFTVNGAMIGVKIRDCENLTMKGISYDYGRTPFSVGDITDSTEDSVTVKFRDHYPITPDTNFNDYLEYDKFSFVPRANGNFLLKSDISKVEIDGQTVKFKFTGAINKPVNGTLAVVSHYTYSYNAFDAENCKDMTLENIDVFATAGMGLVCLTSDDVTVNRFNVRLKPNTDRLMSATADGMHFGACRGDLKITNCLIENTHDDACNVKSGHYFGVGDINRDDNTLKCRQLNYMHPLRVGDVMQVYTDDLSPVAQVKVAEILSFDGTGAKIRTEEAIPESVNTDCLIANASSVPAVTFENNVIRNKRNRGILLQTRHSTVKNNAFFNVGHGAISVMTEAAEFNEAIVPEDIRVENNKIVGCNSMGGSVGGDVAVSAIGKEWIAAPAGTVKQVVINNNFIANTAKRAVNITSASDVSITNNCIYNPALRPVSKQNDCAVSLSVSEDISIKSNYVSNNSASKDYVSLYTDGTVDETAVELEGNTGLAFATVDESVQPDNVYRLPEGVTVDMTSANLDDFAGVAQSVQFVGYTDAYGKEVHPAANDFEIKTFKIAYDDNGIYIAFDIRDDKTEFAGESAFWTGDGFELYFTTATEENYAFPIIRQTYDDTAQLYITPSYLHVESSRTSLKLQDSAAQAFDYKCWLTDDGYAGKLFISFDVCTDLKAAAQATDEANRVVSFSFVFADMETGDDRLQVSNTAHNVETKKGIPVQMGKIRFVNGGESNDENA